MDIRKECLSNRAEYFLDCAAEAGDIDIGTYDTLRLYGAPAAVDFIIKANVELEQPSSYKDRQPLCLGLARYASAILAQLPQERAGALIFYGVASLTHAIDLLAETLSNWAFVDETEGGCTKPFLRKHSRLRRNGTVFKNTLRQVHAPRWIRRYVKRNGSTEAEYLREMSKLVLGRISLVPPELIWDDKAGINTDLQLQRSWNLQEHGARIVERERREQEMLNAGLQRLGINVSAPKKRDVKIDRSVRHKLLKRAAVFAAGLIGASTVSALARGDMITLPGPTVSLQVQKRASLSRLGHGGLSISVADHNGAMLADLCVFFDKTPALDQVSALALHMASGMEREIIDSANITGLSEAGAKHPLIMERSKRQVAHVAIAAVNRASRIDFEAQRQRSREYWEATAPVWREALAVYILGAKIAKGWKYGLEC